jgi:hypothetical protein
VYWNLSLSEILKAIRKDAGISILFIKPGPRRSTLLGWATSHAIITIKTRDLVISTWLISLTGGVIDVLSRNCPYEMAIGDEKLQKIIDRLNSFE